MIPQWQSRKNKVHFISLGCARNLVDTEVMLGIVIQAGYEVTDQEDKAHFLVVNTCGFLESARQEALDTLAHLEQVKQKGARLIVTGCMVQKHSDVLKESCPSIHYLLGPGDIHHILDALRSGETGEQITSARSFLESGEIPRVLSTPSHFAYLKIAEGCAKRCSFCIIPTIKGPLKSKSVAQVLKEFDALRSRGVHEIILIAQDLGDYGKERKEVDGLENLLEQMLTRPGAFWIRLLYLYPDEITEGLIALMEKDKRLLPYLDMPIQHIDNDMLKAMRRKTNREHIITTYETLRKRLPDIVIRTSLMVGFPGETEEQFAQLLSFIEEYPFDHIGVFPFSLEQGASAAKLSGQLPKEVKEERYRRLMEKQQQLVRNRHKKYVGQTLEVMLEGYHPESDFLMRGRFYGQCPEIDGQVIINDGRAVTEFGKLYQVEITDVIDYDLIGKVIQPATPKKKKTSLSLTVS